MKRNRPRQHYRRIRTKRGIKRKLINKGIRPKRKVKRRMLYNTIDWKKLAKEDTSYMLPHEVLKFVDSDKGVREIESKSHSAFDVDRKRIPKLRFKMKKEREISKELKMINPPDLVSESEIHLEKFLQKEESRKGYTQSNRKELFRDFMKDGKYELAFGVLPQGAKNSLALARGFPKDIASKRKDPIKAIAKPVAKKSKNLEKGAVSMKEFNAWLEAEKEKRNI